MLNKKGCGFKKWLQVVVNDFRNDINIYVEITVGYPVP